MLYGNASSYYGFFCQPQVMSVCQFLPLFNTPSYRFLLIIFASFQAQNFIIKKKCVKIVTFSACYV